MTLLGIWKYLGIVTILIPNFPLLKEWAYTGFFLSLSGAQFSHIALGHKINDLLPPLLLITLTSVS
ncbi:MAG: DoxX family protein [Chitinophagaceae bacterium]|nr:DoxX family protein [Chitinophagaceae bacterium]